MSFPTTSVLDSGAGASGAVSGNWTAQTIELAGSGFNRDGSGHFIQGATVGSAYWNAASFGASQEVYFTLNTLPGVGEDVRAYYCYDPTGKNGYVLLVKQTSAGAFSQRIFKVTSGALGTQVGSTSTQVLSAGDAVGVDVNSGTHQMHYKASGGSWAVLGTSAIDSTYTNARIGHAFNSTTAKTQDFGGGTVSSGTTVTPTQGVDEERGEIVAEWTIVSVAQQQNVAPFINQSYYF